FSHIYQLYELHFKQEFSLKFKKGQFCWIGCTRKTNKPLVSKASAEERFIHFQCNQKIMKKRLTVIVVSVVSIIAIASIWLYSYNIEKRGQSVSRQQIVEKLKEAKNLYADSMESLGNEGNLKLKVTIDGDFYPKNIERLKKYNPRLGYFRQKVFESRQIEVEFLDIQYQPPGRGNYEQGILTGYRDLNTFLKDLAIKGYRSLVFEELTCLIETYHDLQNEWRLMDFSPEERKEGRGNFFNSPGICALGSSVEVQHNGYWKGYIVPVFTITRKFRDDPPPFLRYEVRSVYAKQLTHGVWRSLSLSIDSTRDDRFVLAVTKL
ncbi:MAG: hypothetical protein AAB484_02755, partial [Patescibacteria group bacterium]